MQTFTIAGISIAGALYLRHPLAVLLAIVVIGSQQHAMFVLAHEAAHYRLFRNRTLNELVGRLLGSVAGISMCSYRVVHRLHHNDLYGSTDPDIALHGGYPRGRRYLVRKLAGDLTGLIAWKTFHYSRTMSTSTSSITCSRRSRITISRACIESWLHAVCCDRPKFDCPRSRGGWCMRTDDRAPDHAPWARRCVPPR